MSVKILSEVLINKISAGEVIEKPFSVVKELVENSLDANAQEISIFLLQGGKSNITVVDDGKGMSSQDCRLSVERHATSKISKIEDIEEIYTMGFRGEALAAISSVSKFEIRTCIDEKEAGYFLKIHGGKKIEEGKCGLPRGTRIEVDDLFYNTPARKKFLKAEKTEFKNTCDYLIRIAISHPNVKFRLFNNKKEIFHFPQQQNFFSRIKECVGDYLSQNLVFFSHQETYLSFSLVLSTPDSCRPNKRWQFIYINNRFIKNGEIVRAIYKGYDTLLMNGMHPLFFLNIHIHPKEIDVNVHPAKIEVRFQNNILVNTILKENISIFLRQHTRKILQSNTNQQSSFSHTQPTLPNTRYKNPTILELNTPSFSKKELFSDPPPRIDEQQQSGVQSTPLIQEEQKSFRIIGLFHKYILAELTEKQANQFISGVKYSSNKAQLAIMDIHAAHEKIRYEEIKKQYHNKNIKKVPLTASEIKFSARDTILIENNQEIFSKIGFELEYYGSNVFILKTVPSALAKISVGEAMQTILNILEESASFEKTNYIETFLDDVFKKIACHSALRGKPYLSLLEMEELFKTFFSLNIDTHCPHGRPIIIAIDEKELDKKFKRIL